MLYTSTLYGFEARLLASSTSRVAGDVCVQLEVRLQRRGVQARRSSGTAASEGPLSVGQRRVNLDQSGGSAGAFEERSRAEALVLPLNIVLRDSCDAVVHRRNGKWLAGDGCVQTALVAGRTVVPEACEWSCVSVADASSSVRWGVHVRADHTQMKSNVAFTARTLCR